jgi:hypothetical protein
MQTKYRYLLVMLLLFSCLMSFSVTAQAQMCVEFGDETNCKAQSGCYWCPTMVTCYPFPDCPTCNQLPQGNCSITPVCHWCANKYLCITIERLCTCGNKTLDTGEECDGTPHCTTNCKCASGYIPDLEYLGYCKAVFVCGNGILEQGEECELSTKDCGADCKCVAGTDPDPNNPGYCIASNNPPVLDSIGDKTVDEGQLLQFTITASDTDGNTLTYSASNLPTGASFIGQVFSWTPGYGQAGSYQNVLFSVTDNGTPMASDSEVITITVGNVNRPPVLDPIGDKQVDEGQPLQFTIAASDPDGNALTYSASNLPTGSSFIGQTFSWTPAYTPAGNFTGVRFEVSDGSSTDFEVITITVGNINRPPKLDPIGNKTVNVGELLEFTITGTDPDGDTLTYSTSNLPPGASFSNQVFSWTPAYTQGGPYADVCFEVSDGFLTDLKDITITVNLLQATIDINPETLNLKSKGGENSMAAYIELPGAYDVRQISVVSIKLNVNGKMISAQSAPTSIGDYDRDGLYDLMVKFDRQTMIDALGGRTGNMSLTLTGKLNNGSGFNGTGSIKVINPGK